MGDAASGCTGMTGYLSSETRGKGVCPLSSVWMRLEAKVSVLCLDGTRGKGDCELTASRGEPNLRLKYHEKH